MRVLSPWKGTGSAILNIFWPRGVSWCLVLYNVSAHTAQRVILHQRLQQTLALINFPVFDFKSKCSLGRRHCSNFKKTGPSTDILWTGYCPFSKGTAAHWKTRWLLSLSPSADTLTSRLSSEGRAGGRGNTGFQTPIVTHRFTFVFFSIENAEQMTVCTLHVDKQERAVTDVLLFSVLHYPFNAALPSLHAVAVLFTQAAA